LFGGAYPIFAQFFQREIQNRYQGSLSGLLWVFLHPALLMLLYAGLIGEVLKARIPGIEGNQWLPFVALGLWPWLCFSEGIQRGTQSIIDHAGLIGKVALPTHLLVAASVAASFCLHAIGMFAALVIMKLLGYPILISYLPVLLLLLTLLFVFTLGLTWITASVQVYVRDVGQLLGQLLSFWFFLTPIIYSTAMLPEAIRGVLHVNPISFYCTSARAWLLFGQSVPAMSIAIAVVVAITMALFGRWVFARLSSHFEDFL
jgi:lipopolysaccharide transport system permease protein